MVDFRPFHAHRSHSDGCVYNKARKNYTRVNPPKTGWKKQPIQRRLNVAIIKLTNFGYSINQLQQVLHRSTSYIHKVIRNAIQHGALRVIDKRKLPNQTRLSTSIRRLIRLEKIILKWMPFINGEEGEPP